MDFDFKKIEKYWWFNKHKGLFEFTDYNYNGLRTKLNSNPAFEFNQQKTRNDVFDWQKIQPHYSFFYDYIDNELDIAGKLNQSMLINHPRVLVEMPADVPTIVVDSEYFIKNWLDFVDANHQMGCLVCTEDFSLLMEFTDDAKFNLYSNFKI